MSIAMAGFQASDTMPKIGHVTDLREQWLVRTDGVLAHHLQDREINSHLTENKYRNQQIREDFPVALNEQKDLEYAARQEAKVREMSRRRQAEIDAEIAREMAEINLRRQRRLNSSDLLQQPSSSRAPPLPSKPSPARTRIVDDISPEELGLSPEELEEIRKRLEQEEKDARLARELSNLEGDTDALMADMKYAVEAQDGELARLLQEREYKKLQRAKEKARQKALLKKQQRLAAQQQSPPGDIPTELPATQATLLDAYSNPRDLIREQNGVRLCKSVDSDLNYVEPFEKEQIQSKASALQSKQISNQYYNDLHNSNVSHAIDMPDHHHNMPSSQSLAAMQYRQPPPPPVPGKKPRFPDPVSIRPASHYATDNVNNNSTSPSMSQSYSENNNTYEINFGHDYGTSSSHHTNNEADPTKRLSVTSDITPEGLIKKKNKQAEMNKKKKGCKIQ